MHFLLFIIYMILWLLYRKYFWFYFRCAIIPSCLREERLSRLSLWRESHTRCQSLFTDSVSWIHCWEKLILINVMAQSWCRKRNNIFIKNFSYGFIPVTHILAHLSTNTGRWSYWNFYSLLHLNPVFLLFACLLATSWGSTDHFYG